LPVVTLGKWASHGTSDSAPYFGYSRATLPSFDEGAVANLVYGGGLSVQVHHPRPRRSGRGVLPKELTWDEAEKYAR
jgi:hypothetical protein